MSVQSCGVQRLCRFPNCHLHQDTQLFPQHKALSPVLPRGSHTPTPSSTVPGSLHVVLYPSLFDVVLDELVMEHCFQGEMFSEAENILLKGKEPLYFFMFFMYKMESSNGILTHLLPSNLTGVSFIPCLLSGLLRTEFS